MNNQKVYVSSTYKDLKDYREAVCNTLTRMGYRPIHMEDYVAQNIHPLDKCLEDVKNCSFYIGIFAWCYGYQPQDKNNNPDKRSITELEYLCAKESNINRIIYILDKNTLWPPALIDNDREKIDRLRSMVMDEVVVSMFSNEDNLCMMLPISMKYFNNVPRPPQFSRMPQPLTKVEFVGREQELKSLQQYYKEDKKTAIVTIIGGPGLGKSRLVNAFLDNHLSDHTSTYDGTQWKYAWSFYNQDTHTRENSSTEFFSNILRHYGFEDWYVSEDQQASKLVELIRSEKSLLVLDGIEPLQEETTGELRDIAMKKFILELCERTNKDEYHRGLVIITSRKKLTGLGIEKFIDNTIYVEKCINELAPSDGAKLLSNLLEVNNYSVNDLCQVSRDAGGEPLSLVLLGKLLKEVFNGDIDKRTEVINGSTNVTKQILDWYFHRWSVSTLPEQAYLCILQVLSLFSRPATELELKGLIQRKAKIIRPLRDLKQRQIGEEYLIKLGLLVSKSDSEWDTHSKVRKYFGDKFREEQIEMWLEAHGALYSYFSSTGKKRPETQKDMEFVFRAIHHGCLAEKYQKAFELYIQKVARDIDGYITERLGLVAWDLAILSRFFTPQWKDLPTSKLTEKASFILRSRVSYCLELQGRLQEAIAERAKTINYYQREEDWEAVAHGKEKLALMLARTENLNKAKKIAEEAVTYANKARKKQPLSNDESNNIVERQLHCLSALGSICHRLGEFDVAKKHFEKAESIHIEHELDNWPDKKNEKDNIYLYSEPGCRYSALLLDMGEDIGKLRSRAIYMENWTNDQENNSERKPSYLVKAMNKLTIGRIDALGGTEECFNKAINKIDEAISLILQAHNAVYRCQPLLARADLWCQKGKYENAISDLNEVERIAGDMKLYRIDAYLMRTKIRILENDINQAWNDFYEAKECISNFEYPRCLPDFHLINAELCIYDNKSDCEWELEQAYKHSKGFKACTRNFRRDFENFCKNNGFLDMLSQ